MSSRRVRRGRAFWESAVRDQAGSGVTQEEYCRVRGLCPTTLQRWRGRLGYTSAASPPVPAAPSSPAPGFDFVRVVVAAESPAAPVDRSSARRTAPVPPPAAFAELHLPFGAVLRCVPGTDTRWLADLVVACGRAAC